MKTETESIEQQDRRALLALRQAACEYHAKHSRGPGAARTCVCGMGGGGSPACDGLRIIRDLLRYADFDDPQWRARFDAVKRAMN